MTAFPAVTGYVSSIWSAVRASMVYANTALATQTGQQAQSLASTVAATMRNARDCVDASTLALAAAQGFSSLNLILAFSLPITNRQLELITARILSLRTFALTLPLILPTPAPAASVLPNGVAAVPDPGFIEFLLNFTGETVPSGLTAASLPATAQEEAEAWAALVTASAAVQSNGSTQNEISYMALTTQAVATALSHVAVSTELSLLTAWNTLAVVPALMGYATAGANDPTSSSAQQISVIRDIICQTLDQFNELTVILREQPPQQVKLATVRQNDSLMAMAARVLGNFELWTQIAAINNLRPPYIAATRSTGVAVMGDQLYMPTGPVPSGTPQTPPQYEVSFLGVDIYYGPFGQDMLPWTGDLQTIAGYQNLALSLGRRLQTQLGTLIYHLNYGSRIPAAIGAPITQNIVGNLKAYAMSAVLTDQRVAQVLNVSAQVLTSYAINLSISALPKGIGQFGVDVVQLFTPPQVPS